MEAESDLSGNRSGCFGSDTAAPNLAVSRQPGLGDSLLFAAELLLPALSIAPGEQAGTSSQKHSTCLAGSPVPLWSFCGFVMAEEAMTFALLSPEELMLLPGGGEEGASSLLCG